MNTYLLTVLMALLPIFLLAQTSLSGVINQYTQVTNIDYCTGKLTVQAASSFQIGDKVLLIQMKGAQINSSNSGSFGNIDTIGAAGYFEKNEIIAKTGNEIFLKNTLLNTYNVAGALQLVSIPVFQSATVSSLLTAAPWNGATGGVLALEVQGDLVLQSGIDLSGLGFRGGTVNVVNSGCTFLTNANAFYYAANDWRGAPKGEGIADFILNREHGRGAQANGGGGGNDHNAGGGGGANLSNGGNGGRQKSDSAFGCDGDYPGRGGKALPGEPARIFMGGGGGAGHLDDNGAGSAGGNGGGIVLLSANKLVANGHFIKANGITPPQATGDGAGGGGGGGSIYLDVNEIDGSLTLEARGGNGGKVSNSSTRCFGPGGGGGGGQLISKIANPGVVNLAGGIAGENTVASGQCDGPSNGAGAGLEGLQSAFTPVPASQTALVEFAVLSQPTSSIGCQNGQVSFEFVVQGNALSYQWQMNNGTGWVNLNNSSVYAGTKTSILTLFSPTQNLNGNQYRCVATNPCAAEFISQPATLTVVPTPQPNFTYTSLGNGVFQFSNTSTAANSYSWNFGDGNSSQELNPVHTFTAFGTYSVTLTATSDCGSQVFTQQIIVTTAPSAAFTADVQTGCVPLTVQFQDLSSENTTNWQWFFPGGEPAFSDLQNPVVTYTQPGTYAATLVVSNVEGADTVTNIQAVVAKGLPNVNFSVGIDDLTVTFINLSQNVTGGYMWDFGDGETSTEINPTHTYQMQGFFEVTLSAVNGCGTALLTQTISTGDLPLASFSANQAGGCSPLTVQFQNQSSSNANEFFWSFPGGNPATSSEQNPVVVYEEAGTYDVMLTVTNELGEHTLLKSAFVVVQQTPQADFSFEVDSLTVAFTNLSIGGSYYIWTFGDGSTSGVTNPVHTYSNNGIYSVNLIAANTVCGSAIAYQIFINTTDAGEMLRLPSAMVFPNPAGKFLFVKLTDWPSETVAVKLWDMQGRLREDFMFQTNTATLNTADLSAGLYLLELRAGDESVRFKIVKN